MLLFQSLVWIFIFLHNNEVVINIPGQEVSMVMIEVEPGTVSIKDRIIKIDKFLIGKYEVTYDQYIIFQDKSLDSQKTTIEIRDYDAITRPTPPYEDFSKGMGQGGGFPMVSITQQAALRYAQWLYFKTGKFFRLPTEAEWIYVCRKGETERFNLEEKAYYFENGYEKFHKVGGKQANAIGVHDMLGNVAEWTADDYNPSYPAVEMENSWVPPTRKHYRTLKGGSYLSNAEDCTCNYREKSNPRWQMRDPQIPKSKWWNTDAPFVGFRLVVDQSGKSNEEIALYYKRAIID